MWNLVMAGGFHWDSMVKNGIGSISSPFPDVWSGWIIRGIETGRNEDFTNTNHGSCVLNIEHCSKITVPEGASFNFSFSWTWLVRQSTETLFVEVRYGQKLTTWSGGFQLTARKLSWPRYTPFSTSWYPLKEIPIQYAGPGSRPCNTVPRTNDKVAIIIHCLIIMFPNGDNYPQLFTPIQYDP